MLDKKSKTKIESSINRQKDDKKTKGTTQKKRKT